MTQAPPAGQAAPDHPDAEENHTGVSKALAAQPAKFARRKAVIVRAAVGVINRKGVRGMTLADVAGKLKLVPTAVNYYFRRKEDLAAACFLQAIAHYGALLDRSELEPTAEASLQSFLRAFADHLASVDLGEAEPVAAFNDVRAVADPTVDAAYRDMFRRFRRIFDAGLAGEFSRPQRNARTHLLLSQVFWAALWLRQYDPDDYRRMIDRLFDILVNGLMAPGIDWAPLALPRMETPGETPGETTKGSREAFLRAATEMINERGYLGASVSRISARLNVTKGSFYHHNQAKDDLVEQCFDRTLEIMRTSQAAADACATTGLANLASLAASMVRRDVSGEAPLLRTSALTAVPEEMQGPLVRRFERVSARLASVVSDGIADGSIRPVDANVAAQTLTALINASAELPHFAPGVDAASAVEVYVRPLFTGLFRASHCTDPDKANRF